jgi:FixJ family two-component response regulator
LRLNQQVLFAPMTVVRSMVAVVDDEESVRKALHRLMLSAGIMVKTFPSGAEFLDSLKRQRPSCAVLDLHMPGVSGFEIQSRLVQASDNLPLIFITGNHTEETKHRVTSAGAAAYLIKPVDDELLLAAVSAAIGSTS